MKILNPEVDIDAFFEKLKTSNSSLLMLDYDGTLAPFAIDRNSAYPYKEVWQLICTLFLMQKTRIVLISGRMIKSVKQVIPEGPMPELWGCHGFERWSPENGYISITPSDIALEGLDIAENAVREFLNDNRMERKNASLVVHWRGLGHEIQKEIHSKTLKKWEKIPSEYPLEILNFDCGIEIRALGKHKGDVVNELFSEMSENVCAAYLGDDRTDEDAFEAMSGKGLSILVKRNFIETKADIQIVPPLELEWFLESWISCV
jgi:trehalose-phosphatase